MDDGRLTIVVRNLTKLKSEKDYIEFKENNGDVETIAKNISGITNALIRHNIPQGYVIWGVKDELNSEGIHDVVGTSLEPDILKKGNEEFLLWVAKNVKPSPNIEFRKILIDGLKVVVLIIRYSHNEISKYNNIAYVRVGANTRKMSDFPEIEKEIWKSIVARDFETITAKPNVFREEIETLLDLNAFYELRRSNVPVERDLVFAELIRCEMVRDNSDSTYDITNLGALLLAKNLDDFGSLVHKSPRVIVYEGESKLRTISEQIGHRGYATGFDGLYSYILEKVKIGEEISGGIRRNSYRYPELTLRELVANAIVHQDFTLDGMQPMIEIYSNRIEFTNPGKPLIDKLRFIDSPPASRNNRLATELSKLGICERRGSGWDKVAVEIDEYRFPAPKIEVTEQATRVILPQKLTLNQMTRDEQIWAIYIHTCLCYVNQKDTTNSTIRERFGIEEGNAAIATRLINMALDKGLIAIFDETVGHKSRKYIPFWAKSSE